MTIASFKDLRILCWPRALLKGPKRSFDVVVVLLLLGVETSSKSNKNCAWEQRNCKETKNVKGNKKCAREQKMCKGTKNFPRGQKEVQKFPIAMGAKSSCYGIELPCLPCIALYDLVLWPCMALNSLIWPCMVLLLFTIMYGLIPLSMALYDLEWLWMALM